MIAAEWGTKPPWCRGLPDRQVVRIPVPVLTETALATQARVPVRVDAARYKERNCFCYSVVLRLYCVRGWAGRLGARG